MKKRTITAEQIRMIAWKEVRMRIIMIIIGALISFFGGWAFSYIVTEDNPRSLFDLIGRVVGALICAFAGFTGLVAFLMAIFSDSLPKEAMKRGEPK